MQYKPDFKKLNELVVEGFLSKKETEFLILYNYTEKCVFEKKWTIDTKNARGTIYNKNNGEVISRAFSKFFGFFELSQEEQAKILRSRKFEVFTKEDGSMVQIYYYNDKWNTATRGSFESDQAIKATQMLSKYDITNLNKEFTYIVEIIYPENRIIVNYGSDEKLVLLACIDTKTGVESDIEALVTSVPFPIAQSHKFKTIDAVIEAVSKMDSNSEGFVVKLSNGERFKVKSPEYLKIARIMSRMSPLTLWESMKDGKVSVELMQSIPEEFRVDYEVFQQELEKQYMEISNIINEKVNKILLNIADISTGLPENFNKAIGLYLKDNPNELNHFVFPLINNKQENVDKMIMKEIRPTGNIL